MKVRQILQRFILILFMYYFIVCPRLCIAQMDWSGLDAARKTAQKENKLLFVLCGAQSGLFFNELVNNTLKSKRVLNELPADFIFTAVSPQNEEFFKKYTIKRSPTILFLAYENEWVEIDRLVGYVDVKAFLLMIKQIKSSRGTYRYLKGNLHISNNKVEYMKQLAQKCLLQEKTDEAEKLYQRLLKEDAVNTQDYLKQLNYILAVRKNESADFDSALKLLKNDNSAQGLLLKAECYIGMKDFENTAKEINDFLKKFPRHPQASAFAYKLAGIHLFFNHIKAGMAAYIRIIENDPDSYYGRQAKTMLEKMQNRHQYREDILIKRKIVKKVYLVPDLSTFLYYISQWTDKEIFPIFIGKEDFLVRKFITAFEPEEIVRSEAVDIGVINTKKINLALFASWTDQNVLEVDDVDRDIIKSILKQRKVVPRGFVFINDEDDDGVAAGIALASAHDQILEILPLNPLYSLVMSYPEKEHFRRTIIELIKKWGYDFEALNKGVDFITIASDIAYRYYSEFGGVLALDDAINRDDYGDRFAWSGRLIGDQSQMIYQAMCGVFLYNKQSLFFNSYSTQETPWKEYAMAAAAKLLRHYIKTELKEDTQGKLEEWRKIMREGNKFDLAFVNSSGSKSEWQVAKQKGGIEDIPDSVPSVVHFTHSASAVDPKDKKTIAGAWLSKGAYIYFGAMDEPFVQSFNPPFEIVERLLAGESFGQGFRKISREFSCPWKLLYIGDPLATLKVSLTKRDFVSKE
ncbi:MAG: hypothetical protein ABII88_00125 [Candidatus Omnitrophota bacterium]